MSKRIGPLVNSVVYFTIKNNQAAERVAKLLVESRNDCIILPFIDHPGPMSQQILSREFKSLTVCERDHDNRNLFQNYVSEKYPHRTINIHPHDVFDLSFQAYNRDAQKLCSDVVRESRGSTNGDNAQVKFLVPLLQSKYETGFMRNLYYQMTLKLGLCSDIRVQYYFLLSDRLYRYLIAEPGENFRNYRAATVLYNTIFKINKLDSFDLETCFGIPVRKLQKTASKNSSLYQTVHLCWLEPKVDLIESTGPRALIEFRFLVTQMLQKRTVRVINFLDNWFGNCASDVESLGITSDTRSGDLTAEQFLDLHRYLRGRDGYRNSTFLHAAASIEDNLNLDIEKILK